MTDPLRRALPRGETIRYRAALRTGGQVGLTDDHLVVVEGTESELVPLEAVEEVTIRSFDWFLGVLSVLMVGFGLLSLPRSVVGGFAFALFGVASLYRTYRRRNRVSVRLHTRAKPRLFYVEEAEPFERALGDALDAYRRRLDREAAEFADP